MLAVVAFQWNTGFRDYRPEYVNALARGYRKHLSRPHRFVCVTDETEGFSADVNVVPLPEEARVAASVQSPEGPRFPSSYRRLWCFSEAAKALGDVILMSDIDAAVTGAVEPLVDFFEKSGSAFVGWQPSTTWGVEQKRFGGGSWILQAGALTDVWTTFSVKAAAKARAAGYRGSDQAYISYRLANSCPSWPQKCGIYQAQQLKDKGFQVLPSDARIVHFNGRSKPWQLTHIPWIKKHWKAA